jgi:GNAT superfamily N-acetyltransferase
MDLIIDYHAKRLGCAPSALTQPGTTVLADASLAERKRVIVHETPVHTVVQTPPVLAQRLRQHHPTTAAKVIEVLAEAHPVHRWTDYIFHPSDMWVAPIPDPRARLLGPADADALEALNAQLSEKDRELGEVSLTHPVVVGLFDGARCVAAASFLYNGDAVADIGVVTDPGYRGHGLGKAVVTGLIQHRRERLLQYMTQHTNTRSLGIARGLGLSVYITETGLAITL